MIIDPKQYDVIEAALAVVRMGCNALLLTMNYDSIAQMSCNPAIGGLAKSHLVKEIDALGGEMAKVTDVTALQLRMLNTGKGPAVWALRAQVDRLAYRLEMRRRLEHRFWGSYKYRGDIPRTGCSFNDRNLPERTHTYWFSLLSGWPCRGICGRGAIRKFSGTRSSDRTIENRYTPKD
jgi:hypothetical protein